MATKAKDNINPDHYKNSCSLECIEAMEMAFGITAVFTFCKCNAWKYIWRWKNKNGKEDLKKAKWYLDYMLINDDKIEDGERVWDDESINAMYTYVTQELDKLDKNASKVNSAKPKK